MTITRTSKVLVAILLIPPWVAFGVVVYWYFFDTDPPATFSEATVYDNKGSPTSTFKRGETMVVSRERCVYDSGLVLFNRILWNKSRRQMYFLPASHIMLRREGCSRAYNDVTIPPFAEPGVYEYIVTVRYQNNPLVEGLITLPAPEVTVTE